MPLPALRRTLDTRPHNALPPPRPHRTAPTSDTRINHVLVPRDFSTNSTRFLNLTRTDHRALLADLTLHQRG
ncbi:hypothetical protein [Streptomyces sp. NPDC001492]